MYTQLLTDIATFAKDSKDLGHTEARIVINAKDDFLIDLHRYSSGSGHQEIARAAAAAQLDDFLRPALQDWIAQSPYLWQKCEEESNAPDLNIPYTQVRIGFEKGVATTLFLFIHAFSAYRKTWITMSNRCKVNKNQKQLRVFFDAMSQIQGPYALWKTENASGQEIYFKAPTDAEWTFWLNRMRRSFQSTLTTKPKEKDVPAKLVRVYSPKYQECDLY